MALLEAEVQELRKVFQSEIGGSHIEYMDDLQKKYLVTTNCQYRLL